MARKADRRSSRKRRQARPHEYSDAERATAFARAVADGDLPDPAVLTSEQLKEREELQKARKRYDDYLNAPQRVIIVSAPAKPASAAQTELSEDLKKKLLGEDDPTLTRIHREIRRFAVRKFGDWRSVSTTTIMNAAREDEEFRRSARGFPGLSTFERALDRRRRRQA